MLNALMEVLIALGRVTAAGAGRGPLARDKLGGDAAAALAAQGRSLDEDAAVALAAGESG